jgi:hypothetical protein
MQQRVSSCLQLLRGRGDAVEVGNFEFDAGLRYLPIRRPKQASAACESGQTPKCLLPPMLSLK